MSLLVRTRISFTPRGFASIKRQNIAIAETHKPNLWKCFNFSVLKISENMADGRRFGSINFFLNFEINDTGCNVIDKILTV